MPIARLLFTLLVASMPLVSQSASPIPLPGKEPITPKLTAEAIQADVNSLNRYIGTYPPSFSSDAEKAAVYQRWTFDLQSAWVIEAEDPSSESTLALLADLYRQGHNMDVESTGARAIDTIERCLKAYPDSTRCNFTAAYLYLSLNPQYAKKGEATLLHLRELLKPKVDHEVERGMVFAYLYQGKNDEALKQVDYFLTLEPKAAWATELKSALIRGTTEVHSE